jgi:predicted dehydrogenase
MSAPLRFSLIGCGTIAPALARGVAEASDAELVACVDLVPENARELAADFDVDAWYESHEEMLAAADPDAAIVATPSGTHAAIAVDCAEAGVHVLCQKPLDLAVDRLDAMIEACEANGVRLGGLFNTRFGEGPQRAKRLVESGALGDIVLANGTLPAFRGQDYYDSADWRGTYDMDGGCLFNQAIHTVDRLAWFNDGIERVFADLDTVAHEMEAEDVAAVQIRYGNGARGALTATTAVRNHPDYDRIELYGEDGYLVVNLDSILELETDGDADVAVDVPEISGFGVQIEDMAAAIREGREPMIAGREARRAPDAVLAMYDSAERDEPVRVEDFLARARRE